MRKLVNSREKKAKINILVSFLCQILTLLCGLIIPQIMINNFGSETYGATASITQFLAYISLLEGGIGGVARASLYRPLAENNLEVINKIMAEIKHFFKIVAYIFVVYVFFLACFFRKISSIESIDWFSSFLLVLVISISTFAQYFIGISYSILIQASQKTYITNIISISTVVLNTLLIILLIKFGCNIIMVKFISSCVFVMRPVLMMLYVKKNYRFKKSNYNKDNYLNQKWAGLGQHIAYFLYSSTDIVVLTFFVNLKIVAVYSVYSMVVSQVENITSSFTTGMEAIFGDMYAKGEIAKLHKIFGYYDTLISFITTILFSTTCVLIIPFITIYTRDISDMNYIFPFFAVLLILSSALSCYRKPYHNMIIAAGHFKQTQVAAYGEAILNISLSIMLVIKYGLIGVAVGTLCATFFRMIYYAIYLSINIFNRPIILFLKREVVNLGLFIIIFLIGRLITNSWVISNYLDWIICGIVIFLLAVSITSIGYCVFYRKDIRSFINLKIIKNNIKKY